MSITVEDGDELAVLSACECIISARPLLEDHKPTPAGRPAADDAAADGSADGRKPIISSHEILELPPLPPPSEAAPRPRPAHAPWGEGEDRLLALCSAICLS
jgi:hypothetical protein